MLRWHPVCVNSFFTAFPFLAKELQMSVIDQYSVERIADRMAIQDVMYKCCRAIDRLDFDGMRAGIGG